MLAIWLIKRIYSTDWKNEKEIREQQLELVTLTTSLQEEAPLRFLEKVDDVCQRVQILKQKDSFLRSNLLGVSSSKPSIERDWSRTEIGQIKKLLIPEVSLFKKDSCAWPDKGEKVEF